MATTVYDVEEVQLQNGQTVKLKPLSIKELRKFMIAIKKTGESPTEDETLNILIDACAIALEKQPRNLQSCLPSISSSMYEAMAFQNVEFNITDLVLAHKMRKNHYRQVKRLPASYPAFAGVS